ncbi:MAG: hypothetical protein IJD41_01890 [Alphaproteobacteria bacterium]|nr:hypothetical protein [Alphaproteobacteria bacterium]MBQ7128089.1 hypothetical protein [Alphaproteobacteria bacterium]
MNKTLKAAVALSVLAAPAYAANLENPLYMPKQNQMYSKTSVGVMYKVADDSTAHVKKEHDGVTEFPIWRLHEDLGYGITDRLEAYAKVGYTHDGDIDRKGMHQGRVGLKYRAFETTDGFAWDIYADAHLGGVSGMAGSYDLTKGFTYDNYSNGRWGFHAGTQVGKTWSRFTGAAFFEVLQTFGNDNNEIDVSGPAAQLKALYHMDVLPDEISVDLKSTTEFNAGLKTFYQIDDRWSVGAGFTFKHHEDNSVEGLATDVNMNNPVTAATVNNLLAKVKDMNDGFDEYIISLSGSYQLTDATQVTLYGEYTFDDAHQMSQNGTDVKAEIGARVNVVF